MTLPTAFVISPIASVTRLPSETLCEIFRWTLLEPYSRRVNKWRVSIAPWCLTHVCQTWRDVAQSYHYYVHSSATADYFTTSALNAQLQLSLPLTLDIVVDIGDDEQGSLLRQALCSSMVESNRWGRLTLSWGAVRPQILSVLSELSGRLAQLQYLRLEPASPDACWPPCFAHIFAAAPRLLQLDANAPRQEDFGFTLGIPAYQLTHIELHASPGAILSLLQLHANTLIDAALVFDGSLRPSLPHLAPSVTLPYLKRLSLHGDPDCGCLVVPCLENLTLSGCIRDISTILDRSLCALQRLVLRHCDIEPSVLNSLLHHPSVATLLCLRIDLACCGKPVQAFITALAPPVVFTRYISFGLELSSVKHGLCEVDRKMICDTVECSWELAKERGSPLSVLILPNDIFSVPIQERFEQMRIDGLDINQLHNGIPVVWEGWSW
ncbi:hypothetical protein R3P38DRAFT_2518931 [Favolaschia claudopus]|uniref:F-box domain-containing protein n=1 Tax=Favolaschia claudopus TaxID=2862362 RepID=A0AAW0C652_9AGAR